MEKTDTHPDAAAAAPFMTVAPSPPSTEQDHATTKYRVLFLWPGPVPPFADPRRNAQFHLSRYCDGDLVAARWDLPEDTQKPRQLVKFDTLGAFEYHATRSTTLPGALRTIWNFVYSLGTGLRLCRTKGPYDAIIAYGPFTLSLVGWVLARLTGAKLVVEVPGPPTEGFVFDHSRLGWLKLQVARRLVPFVLRRADATRLYYAWQLDGLPGDGFPPAYVFPDFVPVSLINASGPPGPGVGRYILFLGFPFNRKGVDVLIQAFNKISDKHPDVELRIVGYCPDRTPYERLAGDNPRIRFEKGVPHNEAMELMSGCTLFALPARMEGVPRVLIEAMAAQKPVVSTRVSGIPALVEDGRNGLLCEVDDVDGLAGHLDRLLDDPEYAGRLAEEGHRHVLAELTEECFVERFREMMEALVGPPAARRGGLGRGR